MSMNKFLFSCDGSLSDLFADIESLADRLIDEIPEDTLLERDLEEQAAALARQLLPHVPEPMVDRVSLQRDVRPEGSAVRFSLPFAGSSALFRYRPTDAQGVPPEGEAAATLIIWIPMAGQDAEGVEVAFRARVEHIQRWLGLVADELVVFSGRLRSRISAKLEERRETVGRELAIMKRLAVRFRPGTDELSAQPPEE